VTLYDSIGQGYRRRRREDPRILGQIARALGEARSVLNVGAGAGSYEPGDRDVVAIEPSTLMISQRRPGAAPAVCGVASDLPFRDGTFDAAMAVLTIHHWPDRVRGLQEMRRCARSRVVILTWDPSFDDFWLNDYFPEIPEMDRAIFPTREELVRGLGDFSVHDVPVPHDCVDGFLGAYWRRPEAYLDAEVRSAMSSFAKIGDAEPGLTRLRDDLQSGAWDRRYGSLRTEQSLILGYRVIVA